MKISNPFGDRREKKRNGERIVRPLITPGNGATGALIPATFVTIRAWIDDVRTPNRFWGINE